MRTDAAMAMWEGKEPSRDAGYEFGFKKKKEKGQAESQAAIAVQFIH